MWNNLRARHYSVLILVAIVTLESSAIMIDRFISKENDTAFAMESPFQNNLAIADFSLAKLKETAPVMPLKKAIVIPHVIKKKIAKPVNKKIEKTLSVKFVAATDKEDSKKWVKYSIKKGDSLSNIAKLFGAKTSTIKKINNLKNPNDIKAGQTIKIPMPVTNLSYTVKPGDSLSKIATKFSISLESLIKANNLKSHVLLANQKIKIPVRFEKLKIVTSNTNSKKEKKKLTLIHTKKLSLVSSNKLKLIKFNRLQIAKAPAIKPHISFLDNKLLKNPPAIINTKASNKNNKTNLYRVKKGDSLSTIAKRFNTTIAQIKADNNLTNSNIRFNQILKIRVSKITYKVTVQKTLKQAKQIKKSKRTTNKTHLVKYKVRKGECLSVIARKFKTTIGAIVKVNKLSSTIVKAGQKLNIPSSEKRYRVIKTHSRKRAFAMRLPVHGRLSSPYGWRMHPIKKRRLFHAGIDIAAPRGTPIVAAASGRVIFAGYRRGYGKVVIIRHRNGYSTRYGHCSRLLVRTAQRVRAGKLIARVGATGVATGNHLHFEIRKNGKTINPLRMVHLR